MKKILAVLAAITMAITFTGCEVQRPNGMASYDFNEMSMDFIQLSPPNEGDTVATINTDNANSGKYNQMPVKGVVKGQYFLTGGHDTEKGAYVGRDSDKELVFNEYTPELWPYRGALLSFSEKNGYSDDRWLICGNDEETVTEEEINRLVADTQNSSDKSPEEIAKIKKLLDTFLEQGGLFGYAGERTVFGQVYEGLDVAEKLMAIPAGEDGSAKETVLIKTVTISVYHTEQDTVTAE